MIQEYGGEEFLDLFKALAEESRLRIIALLMEGELCVCEIEACLNFTQSNASRHLNVLKKSGILESYKKAQWAYFRINEDFKEQHNELWCYLQAKVRDLPTFQRDSENWAKCRLQDLCNKGN